MSEDQRLRHELASCRTILHPDGMKRMVPMKILIIGKTLDTGGTSRYTTNLVRNLRMMQKLDFDFINLRRFYDLPGKYAKRLNLILKFPKGINYDKYDLIHFLEFDYSLYGMLKHLGKRKKRVKIVKTSHGIARLEEIYKGVLGKLVLRPLGCYAQEYMQKKVDAVIYVSDDQRELFVKQFKLDRAKTYVTYLASSFETYTGTSGNLIESKENMVLFVGRVETRKRIEKIFELALLMPDVKFKVIGHVSDYQYYYRLQTIKPDNVEVLTDIPDDELVPMYQRAKYFVSFSKWENCPVTYLESISQGTPVIAYSMPIRKMVENGCGFKVQTPAECVAKMRELEEEYDSVVKKTISTARLFSWERTAEETLQIYRHVLCAV